MAKRNCQLDTKALLRYVGELKRLAAAGDEWGIQSLLQEIVPEYEPLKVGTA